MDRREIIGLGLGAGVAAALPANAQADTDTITLWPGIPPGGEGPSLPPFRATAHEPAYTSPVDRAVDRVRVPSMVVFRPAKPDGSALIIAPGGGYSREMFDFEGADVARRFNAAGVTCFVLRYRLPAEGWKDRSDVPLQDAQRAMRLVRAHAAQYGVDPARIGFMGFSAGGHVAVSIATRFAAPVYKPVDAADRMDARPSFSVPMYPVVTMGDGAHQGSRDRLLGLDPSPARIDAYSAERHVVADTPPTFICLAADDDVVPPLQNGLAYYAALLAARIPTEIHFFEAGGHGFGIARTAGKPDAAWPDLLLRWGAASGFFKNSI